MVIGLGSMLDGIRQQVANRVGTWLAQRLGPGVEDTEPVRVAPGERLDQQELVERLVLSGYRREYQVEHRGEVAVRGSIIDVFPSTADRPVRIDLWGDEVDRLAEFSVADQRSGADLTHVELYPARELLPTAAVRERAERLLATDPWGREQWQRLADGEVFEGMEAWLPWLVDHDGGPEHVLVDLLDDDGLVLLVEPRRLRDRVGDVLAEEADLGATLARTWGLDDRVDLPRLHLDMERLLERTEAPTWSVAAVPDSPDTPAVASSAWPPAVGGGEALIGQLRQLVAVRLDQLAAAIILGEGLPGRRSHLCHLVDIHWPSSGIRPERPALSSAADP